MGLVPESHRSYADGVIPWRGNAKPSDRALYFASMTPIPRLSLSHQIAWQAEFIVDNLQQTDYQHTDNIAVDRGVYDCDCSGFVSFVLQRAAPDHYAMIPKEATQPRPRAFKYYEFFD